MLSKLKREKEGVGVGDGRGGIDRSERCGTDKYEKDDRGVGGVGRVIRQFLALLASFVGRHFARLRSWGDALARIRFFYTFNRGGSILMNYLSAY